MTEQPIEFDEHGVIRFKANAIVRYLLDNGGLDLNQLVVRPEFSTADWEQFYQLIGYSVSGYGELSRASKKSVRKADKRAEELLAERKVER